MRFANPAGLWLLALALPVLALHVLRPRRLRTVVSSTFLWQGVERPVSAAQPWQRLRRSWLLALQLLAVALLAGAVARPVRLTAQRLARHTVFLIDTSGSMAAADGTPTRLDEARRRARALRDELPAGGLASVVSAGVTPRVLLSASADRDAFDRALDALGDPAGVPDLADAATLAASLETPDAPVGVVFLSDGGVTDLERKLLPAGTRYERIGADATDRAITQLAVEGRDGGLTAHLTIRSTGGPEATQTVRLDVDGRTAWTEQVTIEPAQVVQRSIELPPGERVEAFLEGEDLLAADDHAFAVGAARAATRVLVMGPDDPFLATLLGVLPGVTVERSPTARAADGFDLAVYDGVDVPADPGAPFLAIAPPSGTDGVRVTGVVEQPAITTVAADPLLEGLDLSAVGIATAQRIEAPADRVLVGADGAPLLLSGSRQGRRFAYLGFALADSNLPLQVAYPLLVDRLVRSLSGAAAAVSDVRVGDVLPVDGGTTVQVQSPTGTRREVAAGSPAPRADRAGFWTLRVDGRADRVVAVNVPERESSLAPAQALDTGTRELRPGETPVRGERSLLPWLAGALAAAVVAEWLLARRRRGVSRRQWRWATGVRIAVLACVAVALVAPSVHRRVGRVATMFLVDASDSMGPSGRDAAVRWVRDALAAKRADDRAAVAMFGGDARLELTMQRDPVFAQPSVLVDATQTNLARALRLGAAVLPADARRRVVVVSDGRPTTGDVDDEVTRLAAAGIPVEFRSVAGQVGGDVSVVRVDTTGTARAGETVTVRAVVASSSGGPARVTLWRGDEQVAERVVDTVVGETPVTFDVALASPGTERFRVTVQQAVDAVPENDTGYAAVQVEGPPRVLVVEGAEDEGAPIVAALTAGGLPVDRVRARDVPALDVLAGYAATVLVDVDTGALSAAQVATLTAASRDLGKGLVVIGGERAYELGGYRNSELEAILPVISEVLDPKRKLDVAQVLAIDTSGSMAACHCAEGAGRGANGMPINGAMTAGGIDKTDISRAAAARTIDALDDNDEVGLLAFNTEQQWIIPLQQLPSEQVVREGLGRLHPEGGTDLHQPLLKAAEALKNSKAKLKHVILFTDGFSSNESLDTLVAQAKQMADEGITVSVLATGEVAYEELERVAVAGRGRFYAGRDLLQVPQIMAQEAVIAARDVVVEGNLLPRITSNAAPVRELTAAPPILGYVATTAKPTAQTHLQIGPEADPLLASWQAGLGRVTAWTSDAAARWSKAWASWDGYVGFWSAVVKDTFPTGGDGSVRATVVGDRMKITVERAGSWGEGATATARVTGADLVGRDVPLTRVSGDTFAGEIEAPVAGTYAVGAAVNGPAGTLLAGSALATQSYSPEYRPGAPDEALLTSLSARTGGRGAIEPGQAFDPAGLAAGQRRIRLAGAFLLTGALLWPLAVALGLLALRGTSLASVGADGATLVRRVWDRRPALPGRDRPPRAAPRSGAAGLPGASGASGAAGPPASPPAAAGRPADAAPAAAGGPADAGAPEGAPSEPATDDADTVKQLLARKRGRSSPR